MGIALLKQAQASQMALLQQTTIEQQEHRDELNKLIDEQEATMIRLADERLDIRMSLLADQQMQSTSLLDQALNDERQLVELLNDAVISMQFDQRKTEKKQKMLASFSSLTDSIKERNTEEKKQAKKLADEKRSVLSEVKQLERQATLGNLLA